MLLTNHNAILRAAASAFGIGPWIAPVLHFSEHSFVASYRLDTGKAFLRVTDNGHKTFENIVGEMQWIDFLDRNDMPVSKPIRSVEGNLAERVRVEEQCFTAVCFEEAQGRPVNDGDRSEALFNRMGKLMGKLHRITKGYIHEDPIARRPEWSAETKKVKGIRLPDSENGIIERYHALIHYLERLGRSKDDYGLIHADLHVGNMFINGDSISVIDFDACRYSWFVDDMAIALFFASPLRDALDYADAFLPPLLEEYRTENKIDDEWLREIPYFVGLRETGRYIKLFHACKGDFGLLHPWGRTFMTGRKETILGRFPKELG